MAASSRIERIEVEPGVRLAVEVAPPSSKPVVMLSNSIGASMTMWDEFAARMSDKVRIVRYDTRGHGQSDVPKGPTRSTGSVRMQKLFSPRSIFRVLCSAACRSAA